MSRENRLTEKRREAYRRRSENMKGQTLASRLSPGQVARVKQRMSDAGKARTDQRYKRVKSKDNTLTAREMEMVLRREKGATLQEIGAAFNFTRERVRQIVLKEKGNDE